MNHPSRPLQRSLGLAVIGALILLSGCVYRLDVQQGNLVDADKLAKVDVGMTRSQVRFLLGTPMVADAFHQNRWDYPYYLKKGRHTKKIKKSWFVVYFEGDHVVRIDRDPGAGEVRPAKKSGEPAPKIDLGA